MSETPAVSKKKTFYAYFLNFYHKSFFEAYWLICSIFLSTYDRTGIGEQVSFTPCIVVDIAD